MGKYAELSDEVKESIIVQHSNGTSGVEIAKCLGIPRSSVSVQIKKHKESGGFEEEEGILRIILDDKESETVNNVEHPEHYNEHGIECIKMAELFNFNRGNAIKYIWRAGKKKEAREIEDLQKALFYIDREIERIKEVIGK